MFNNIKTHEEWIIINLIKVNIKNRWPDHALLIIHGYIS